MNILKLFWLFIYSVTTANAKCTICSFLHDYYDESSELRQDYEPVKSSEHRTHSVDNMEQAVLNSLTRVTDLTSSLFGNLIGLADRRKQLISSSDIPPPLKVRGTIPEISSRVEKNSNSGITSHLFDIFDSIGSGIIRMSHLDGPHICTRETTTKKSTSDKTLKSEKICQRFRDANKCIDRKTGAKGSVETIRIEECCDGYETLDIFKYGCPIESSVLEINDALDLVNSSLWRFAKDVHLENKLIGNNITIFVSPENVNETDDMRSYVLNRIVPGIHRTYDWADGTILKTVGGGDLVISQSEDLFGSVRNYANCLLLNESSYRLQNGMLYFVDGNLRPAYATVLAALESDARFSTFATLLSDNLRDLLSSNQSFTVFVPSEKVFSSMSKSLLKDIKTGTGCASNFTHSHIMEKLICSFELSHHRLKSLAGSEVETRMQVRNNEKVTYIGRARFVNGDVYARNGVVHIIDDVLINDEFLSWKEHLEIYNTHLADTLRDVVEKPSEPITIFVPPVHNNTIPVKIAMNHIVSGEILQDLQHRSTIETDAKSVIFTGYSLRPSPISVRISLQRSQRQLGQLGCSRVIRESVRGCHSILHFIDKPLPLITDNFETFLRKSSGLSKFYRLWRESSLNASLTSEKPITVFIPSDDSFSNNGFKKLIKNSTLSDIFVKRHILNEPLCEFDIHHHPSEIRIQTYVNLNGEVLRPVQHGDDIFIDGAKIEESEIVLSNGVAYILDSTISRDYISIQPDINRRTGTNLLNIISSH